jgi:ABC-2 type transport system ATP-binding protein
LGLLGPNGAGKTTTLEMIEGIVSPTSGEIYYRGHKAGREFKERTGIQFQSTALQDYLTVRDVLRLFARLYRKSLPIEELVRLCSLSDILDRDSKRLSGGQRQRVLLAVALVNDPDLIFLDEPTTGLDPQARRNFWSMIEGIKAQGKTVVLTTHYMEEAYVLCDDIAIMDHGVIIARGAPDELLKEQFEGVWIELPMSDADSLVGQIPWRHFERHGTLQIQSKEVNETLRYLMDRNVALQRLKVRSPTLEDLFLELTGREVRT